MKYILYFWLSFLFCIWSRWVNDVIQLLYLYNLIHKNEKRGEAFSLMSYEKNIFVHVYLVIPTARLYIFTCRIRSYNVMIILSMAVFLMLTKIHTKCQQKVNEFYFWNLNLNLTDEDLPMWYISDFKLYMK